MFCIYIASAELSTPPVNKGEVLVFRRGAVPASALKQRDVKSDEESRSSSSIEMVQVETHTGKEPAQLEKSTSVFNWEDPLASNNLLTEEELAIAETAERYCQERMLPRVLRMV